MSEYQWQPQDKIDLNTRFHTLDNHIQEKLHNDYRTVSMWTNYLQENGYFDDPYKCEWDEQWLEDAITEGEKIIGRMI